MRAADTKRESKGRDKAGIWVFVALAALLAFHLAVNIWWLSKDNHPLLGDDSQHLLFAKLFHKVMARHEWSIPFRAALVAVVPTGIYPPLFHIAAASLACVLGAGNAAFIFTNTIVFLMLILAVYWVARWYMNPWESYLAAFTVSFLPLMYGMSRLCLTDLLSCLLGVLAFGALCRSDSFRNTRWAVALGLLTGLGLWVRWITWLYYLVPCALFAAGGLVRSIRTQPSDDNAPRPLRVLARNVSLVMVLGAAIAAPWYAPRLTIMHNTYENYFKRVNGPNPFLKSEPPRVKPATMKRLPETTLPTVRQPEARKTAAVPQQDRPRTKKDKLGPLSFTVWSMYALYVINKGVFLPAFLVALAGIGVVCARGPRDRRGLMIAAWFLGSYLLLTLMWSVRAPAPRYVAPMLPAVAILCVFALTALPGRLLRATVTGAFCALLLFQFWNISMTSGNGFQVEIPVLRDHLAVRSFYDEGVVVFKDRICASGALVGPPLRGKNWVDRVFDAMTENEVGGRRFGGGKANIQILGTTRRAIRASQERYWPLENPTLPDSRRVGRPVNPYVPLLSVTRGQAAMCHTRAAGRKEPFELASLLDAGKTIAIPPDGELEIEFASTQVIDAVELVIAGQRMGEDSRRVQWHDESSGRYRDFSPAIEADRRVRCVHGVTPVETRAIRIVSGPTTGSGAEIRVSRLQVYRHVPQPRPFFLIGSWNSLRELPDEERDKSDYIVFCGGYDAASAKTLEADFRVIAEFDASILGYWDERGITVLARRSERPKTGAPDGGMRLSISAYPCPGGRWSVPW